MQDSEGPREISGRVGHLMSLQKRLHKVFHRSTWGVRSASSGREYDRGRNPSVKYWCCRACQLQHPAHVVGVPSSKEEVASTGLEK